MTAPEEEGMHGRPPAHGVGRDDLASEAQIRALYLIGRDRYRLTEGQVKEASFTAYGRPPEDLSKREAGVLIGRFQRDRPHVAGPAVYGDPDSDRIPRTRQEIESRLEEWGFKRVNGSSSATAILRRPDDGVYVVIGD